jgi:hypothetical protein
MTLLYVAWIAAWQAICDPSLWTNDLISRKSSRMRGSHKGNERVKFSDVAKAMARVAHECAVRPRLLPLEAEEGLTSPTKDEIRTTRIVGMALGFIFLAVLTLNAFS